MELLINGDRHQLEVDQERTLLSVLREELGLTGVGSLERAQEEARGVEFDGGEAGRHGRKDLAQYTGWHLHSEWSFM